MPTPDPSVGCYIDPPLGAWLWWPALLLPEAWQATASVVLAVFVILGALALAGLGRPRRETAAPWIFAATSFPVLGTAHTANMTAWATLVLALIWRLRASPWVGLLVAALCMVKPMAGLGALIWLFVTRRWRALAKAGAGGSLALVVWMLAWGAESPLDYIDIVIAWAAAIGPVSWNYHPGEAAGIFAGALWILAAGVAALRSRVLRGELDTVFDATAMFLATAAAILFSPVVWAAYTLLFMVPLAAITREVLTNPILMVPEERAQTRLTAALAWGAFTLIWLRGV
jgi:hypothetical protein